MIVVTLLGHQGEVLHRTPSPFPTGTFTLDVPALLANLLPQLARIVVEVTDERNPQ